jgi:hypothetical protein
MVNVVQTLNIHYLYTLEIIYNLVQRKFPALEIFFLRAQLRMFSSAPGTLQVICKIETLYEQFGFLTFLKIEKFSLIICYAV